MNVAAKVIEMDGVEYVSIEPVPAHTIEFRLYYDENGRPLFYSCENLEGNYVVIDKQTYAEMRYDICVVNGEIRKLNFGVIISKLKPHETEGTSCDPEDLSIIVDQHCPTSLKWKLDSYELR